MAPWSLGKGRATSPRQDWDRQLALDWLNTAGDESEFNIGNGDDSGAATMSPMKRKCGIPRKNAQTTTTTSNDGRTNTVGNPPSSPVQPKKKRGRPRKYPNISPENTDDDRDADNGEFTTQASPLTRSRKRRRDLRLLSAKKNPKKRRRQSHAESSSDDSDSGSDSDVGADTDTDSGEDSDREWAEKRRTGIGASPRRTLGRGLRPGLGEGSRLRRRTQPQRASRSNIRPQDDMFALGATPPPPAGTQEKRSIPGLRKKAFFQSSESEEEDIVATGEQCEVMIVVNQLNKEEDTGPEKQQDEQGEEMDEEPEISQPKTDSQDRSFQPTGETEERREDEQLDEELDIDWDPRDNLSSLENSGRSEQRTQEEGTTNETANDSQDTSFHPTADSEREEKESGQEGRQEQRDNDPKESNDNTAEVGDTYPETSQEKNDTMDESYQFTAEKGNEMHDTSGVGTSQEKEAGEDESYELFVREDDDTGGQRHEEEEGSQRETRFRLKETSKVIEYRGYRTTGVDKQDETQVRASKFPAMEHEPEGNGEDIGESFKNDEYMDIDDILNGQRSQTSNEGGQSDDKMENHRVAGDANEHDDEMAIDGPPVETEAPSEQAQQVHNDATAKGHQSDTDEYSTSSSSEESEEEEIDGLMDHPAFKEASRVFDQEETWLEMVDESQKLLRKARQYLKPLSASLHELLASVQRARNAFNESINHGEFVEPDKDLIPDLDRKISTVLSEIKTLPEEEICSMSRNQRLQRQQSLRAQITGIQTYVVPQMVQMIVPAAIIHHYFENTRLGHGLGDMRELFRLLYALCNETKPSRYIDEQDVRFKDRLQTMRPTARLLFYVYVNEMSRRLPQALPQRRQHDRQRQSVGAMQEDAIRIASKSPTRTARSSSLEMLSSPHESTKRRALPWPKRATVPKKTKTKRTTEARRAPAVTMSPVSLRRQWPPRSDSGSWIRLARPVSSSRPAEPSPEAFPQAEIPLTSRNIEIMVDGLHTIRGMKFPSQYCMNANLY